MQTPPPPKKKRKKRKAHQHTKTVKTIKAAYKIANFTFKLLRHSMAGFSSSHLLQAKHQVNTALHTKNPQKSPLKKILKVQSLTRNHTFGFYTAGNR